MMLSSPLSALSFAAAKARSEELRQSWRRAMPLLASWHLLVRTRQETSTCCGQTKHEGGQQHD